MTPRLLLLLPTSTYRTEAFVDAAHSLGVDLTVASELPSSLEGANPSGLLTLDLEDPTVAAEQVFRFHGVNPIDCVMGVDDRTVIVAAEIAERIGLDSNSLAAVQAAGDKGIQREILHAAQVPVPEFREYTLSVPAEAASEEWEYPVVIKPVSLSASRGVIRADDETSFKTAWRRIEAILKAEWPDRSADEHRILVESFVPGHEYAVEGLVREGQLHVFTIFDKPDPLDGPFFEETIYLTPSQAEGSVQNAVVRCVQASVTALGLVRGPVHAEVRVNARGVWMIELAARPIGGRCSGVFAFDDGSSLEAVLVADAMKMLPQPPVVTRGARGVMMIPTPQRGLLKEIEGVDDARRVAGVTEVTITVFPGQELIGLPEGARYLGFIFATGESAEDVDGALRKAHGCLTVCYEESA